MAESRRQLLVRVASAVVLLPFVLWLLWLGGWWFIGLAALAAAVSGYELAGMAMREAPAAARWLVVVLACAMPVVLSGVLAGAPLTAASALFSAIVVAFFVVAVAWPGDDLSRVPAWLGMGVTGVVYVGGMIAAVVRLRVHGPAGFWWVFLLMAVTWLNDTGAYFAGHAFGRHKLAPRVSPGKTVEGAVGGLAASIGGAFLFAWLSRAFPLPHVAALPLTPLELVAIGVLGGVFGPIGDLAESLLKRAYGAKDSGKTIPGHGGLLDRIDALLVNAVVLYAFLAVCRL